MIPEADEITKFYNQGFSDREIGKKFGRGRTWAWSRRSALGLGSDERINPQSLKDEDIRRMNAEGKSDPEICRALGVSDSCVRQLRMKEGLRAQSNVPIDREYLAREFDESMKALQAHGDREGVVRHMKRVATEIGASYERVKKIYTNELFLVEPFKHPRPVSEEEYEDAGRLLKEHNMPYSEVMEITGISRDRLRRRFPGMGASPSDARRIGWAKELERQMGIKL